MDLAGMTDAEYINYSTNLIPRLMRKRPGEWTLVADIATDPARFVEVVECLASYRVFDNTEGYCMITIIPWVYLMISGYKDLPEK